MSFLLSPSNTHLLHDYSPNHKLFVLSPFLTIFFLAHPLQVDGSVVLGVVIDVVYGGFLFGIIVLTKLTCHKSAY